MNDADPSQRLSALSACAYRLGLAFAAEAEQAASHERRMEFFHLFDRCFFSVRVATALELRLRKAGAAPVESPEIERAEIERDERPEGAERDRPERHDERDRERDAEREPASLPLLLRTLGGVAADASALPGPPPASLPTLRELLAQMTSEPAEVPRAAPLKSRLAGSAMSQARPTPARPDLGGALVLRRATGPPRR